MICAIDTKQLKKNTIPNRKISRCEIFPISGFFPVISPDWYGTGIFPNGGRKIAEFVCVSLLFWSAGLCVWGRGGLLFCISCD